MSTASTSKVNLFYSAVASGEIPTALAILGERIEWYEAHGMPYRAERPYRGAAEVADQVLGPINSDVEALTLTVERIVDLGDYVAVVGRYSGTARSSRQAVDQPFVHIWTLDDAGVPLEFHQYTDASRFTDALAH